MNYISMQLIMFSRGKHYFRTIRDSYGYFFNISLPLILSSQSAYLSPEFCDFLLPAFLVINSQNIENKLIQ